MKEFSQDVYSKIYECIGNIIAIKTKTFIKFKSMSKVHRVLVQCTYVLECMSVQTRTCLGRV